MVRKAGLIVNDGKELAVQTATSVQKKLEKSNFEVVRVSSSGGMVGFANPDQHVRPLGYTNCVPEGFDSSMEFAIVLGGDGTVLSAARQTAPAKIPILTINTGHLGFLAEAYLSNLDEAIDKIIAGNWDIEERTCFMRHAPVDISADGVILSTPTGSTAYSLSAGGPVITPDCPVVQLTPIAPHSLASRALVFNDSEPVTVFPATPERLVMVVDGNAGCYVWPEDRVLIRKSKHSVKFIRLEDHEFFQVLRNKLGWGLPHVAKPNK